MGDIVNLRRVRKVQAKADAKADASANRLTYGRTKAEREITEAERERASRLLDNVKLED